MPERAPPTSAAVRPCAGRPSSMPGVAQNLYMRRVRGQLQLSIEHCAAPGRDWMPLALTENPPVLEAVETTSSLPRSAILPRTHRKGPRRSGETPLPEANPQYRARACQRYQPSTCRARRRRLGDKIRRRLSVHRPAGIGASCLSQVLQELFPSRTALRPCSTFDPQCDTLSGRPPTRFRFPFL
jgi:hypothetical protein